MKQCFAVIILALLSLGVKCQEKTFSDFYFEAQSLTQNLKTYKILILLKDTSYTFISNEYRKNILPKAFNFLNNKKIVSKNPDFLIKIKVSNVNADVSYTTKPYTSGQLQYDITTRYDVSFAIAFEVGEQTINFSLCNKEHFENTIPYSVEYISIMNPANLVYIDKSAKQKSIDEVVMEQEIFLNTKADFIGNFNDLLMKQIKK